MPENSNTDLGGTATGEREVSIADSIANYLQKAGDVGDPEALRLLRCAEKTLRNGESEISVLRERVKTREKRVETPMEEIVNMMKIMQERLSRMEEKGKKEGSRLGAGGKQTAEGGKTFAAVAGAITQQNVNLATEKRRRQPVVGPKQKSLKKLQTERAIIVRIPREEQRKRIEKGIAKELTESFTENVKGIVGMTRLNNGNVRVITESIEVKRRLQQHTGWAKAIIADSATVNRRTYAIEVADVRMANVNTKHPEEAIQHLIEENKSLHPGLKIAKIAWSGRAIRLRKSHSTLHLEVESPAMANRLITEGLINDYEWKWCQRAERVGRLTQCFQCYKYGHIGRHCKEKNVCGRCAGAHTTKICDKEAGVKACAACGEKGHEAWAPVCSEKKLQKRKADARAARVQAFFDADASKSPAVDTPANSVDSEGEEIPNGWRIVTHIGKKRSANRVGIVSANSKSSAEPQKEVRQWADVFIMSVKNRETAEASAVKRPRGRPPGNKETASLRLTAPPEQKTMTEMTLYDSDSEI